MFYHELQSKLWRTTARFCAVAAGRGSGKSEIARRRVVRFLAVKKPWPDPKYFYAAPTLDQAIKLAWLDLKNLTPKEWLAPNGISESQHVIRTVFGSALYLVGMDKPARIEGVQWDGGVLDESSDQKPKAFDLSVFPALSHRQAWCWRIGVPKRQGCGAAEFKAFFDRGSPPGTFNADIESYTWPSEDILLKIPGGAKQLEWAKANLAIEDYREQFQASWETASGLAYYAFSPTANVTDNVHYRAGLPYLVACDFNVSPLSWVICQSKDVTLAPTPPKRIDELWVLDEISMNNSNTPAALNELHKRYGGHPNGWMFFGDASSKQRHTSASHSDYAIISNDPRFRGSRLFFPDSNPPVMDRLAATNAGFCNVQGDRRIKIHPKCKKLIDDLLKVSFKEGVNDLDKSNKDLTHMSDALGYLCYRIFKIKMSIGDHVPQVGTSSQGF